MVDLGGMRERWDRVWQRSLSRRSLKVSGKGSEAGDEAKCAVCGGAANPKSHPIMDPPLQQ
jgi:hypothetical protein